MCVTSINILNCSEGEILASDVYSTNGKNLIVAKGTVINRYILGRLMDMGITIVSIYKEEETSQANQSKFELSYKKIAMLTKEILHNIISGKSVDYNILSVITAEIYQNIHNDSNIINCITEIKKKDEYTYYHCINVAFYTMLIAKWLKLSEEDIQKAILSGLLHDIGKLKISEEILNKTGRLTQEEFEIIKGHPLHGFEIAKTICNLDNDVRLAILLHHERMDGSGYPFRYAAYNINRFARIVAVADVFDAMTSERVYKSRNTPFEVFEMFMMEGIGIFDINILNTFMKNMSYYLIGSRVLLNNGTSGDVVYIPCQCMTSPIIKISEDYIDLSMENTLQVIKML